jgi:hypothetical protein
MLFNFTDWFVYLWIYLFFCDLSGWEMISKGKETNFTDLQFRPLN